MKKVLKKALIFKLNQLFTVLVTIDRVMNDLIFFKTLLIRQQFDTCFLLPFTQLILICYHIVGGKYIHVSFILTLLPGCGLFNKKDIFLKIKSKYFNSFSPKMIIVIYSN